ncbi:MAG: YHS domain protein [Verrucomicrobiaceae bacterium]|nr:YHS domain protein [Verrucomicrobiaceae bacterium]
MIKTSRHFLRLCAAVSLVFASSVLAGIENYNLPANKVAIQGYDPVTYFTLGKAVMGNASFKTQHEGVTYQFSSAETMATFTASPAKYVPTYGGWCATAMAKGEKVEIDPKNFKVTNGRLFLFFNAWYGDAKKTWLKDESGQEAKADANWKKLSGE